MHINPKFANRPLPSIPPPKPARTSLVRTQSASPAQLPPPPEPVYAKLGDPSLNIDHVKKGNFEESIRKSVENNKVLINPNFSTGGTGGVTRRHAAGAPSKPVRHSMMVTSDMTKHLDLKLKKVKSVACITPKTNLPDKENLPSTSKSKNLFTPLRKSAFKKIGSRKLVRRKSKSPGTPKASFKKIGNKKLIRVVESGAKDKNSTTPYDVKTKTKIIKNVKNTPSNASKYRFSFITPLSIKKPRTVRNSGSLKKTSGKKSLSNFRSRFKLDRRAKQSKAEPKVLFQSPSQSRLKTKSGATYRVSATKLSKLSQAPPKPHRHKVAAAVPASLATSKVISVQGVKFSVADNGRKLRRIPSASTSGVSSLTSNTTSYSASMSCQATTSSSPQTDTKADSGISSSPVAAVKLNTSLAAGKKMYLGGEELEEVEPGVFTRSRHSLTRQSITQAKNRSINTIMKNATRSKQYCMFFNKFGKCNKKEAGNCPFIHDKEKIAVCRRFLQGSCHKENCLLSHKASPEKMPVCKFFLEGVCSKENCPYLHVKVSEKAAICQAFLKGYCSNGSDCKQRHVMACPEYDKTGVCSKPAGKCPFPHINKTAALNTEKKVPPVKPKRKSLGQTPADHKKSRVQAARYYDDSRRNTEEDKTGEAAVDITPELESKRKRLLHKIELAKQGWTGVSVSVIKDESEGKLDDSGPYEKIDSDSSDEEETPVAREPIGHLGDFISLAGYSSEDEEIHTDHRLI